ncbi:MAG: hypothetical protein J6A38_04825 [Clostridia bacterium]|nr:hypothetical protein [Clostridia bacterium]
MEKFAIGMVLGCIGGALLVTNNYKMRTLVRKGQEEAQAKLDQIIDEKIQKCERATKTIEDETVKEDRKSKKSDKK